MSPFKKAAVKEGGSKGKELVIDVDDFSPKTKRTRSPSGVFDPNKFKSYAAFQTHKNYFRDATLLLERPVDQLSRRDTEIPQWFAHKDWNYLLFDLDEAYENLVKEFYANAILEGEELKCWVRRKSFSVSPAYLAEILHINRLMLKTHQFMMIFVQMRNCLRMVLDKTWNSHPMETQSAFPLSLLN